MAAFVVLLVVAVFNSSNGSTKVLPDVMGSIRLDGGTERVNNTKDEYASLIHEYGYPDSILSTENDTGSDKPLVVMDPKSWTQKRPFLRWWAALKMKESQCHERVIVTHPA